MVTEKKPLIRESEFLIPALQAGPWVDKVKSQPQQPWLLNNMVMPGGLTIIGGQEKLGKSFHALLMSVAMATGRQIGPFEPVGRSAVLYLDLEGVAIGTAERLECLAVGHNFRLSELGGLWMAEEREFQLLEEGGAARLAETVRALGVQTVVLDTFAACFSGEENSKKETQKFLNVLKEVRTETGCAVVMPHHVNKASIGYKQTAVMMSASSGLRGSSAIAAAFDVAISCQDGYVEGEFSRFMCSRGKRTGDWWCRYDIKGLKDARKQWTSSWVEYGEMHDEFALIESGPDSQSKYRGK